MKLGIGYATQKSSTADCLTYKSLSTVGIYKEICHHYPKLENTRPLSIVYNEIIDEARANGDTHLLLVHDDVSITDHNILNPDRMMGYDVVGVAGNSSPVFLAEDKMLWHWMSNQGEQNLRGFAGHYTPDGSHVFMTSFGVTPAPVQMIDGVFMMLDLTKDLPRFDESSPARFHFYDLDFSYACYKKGLKVGVSPYVIYHQSQGLKQMTPEWLEGSKWFYNKWAKQ